MTPTEKTRSFNQGALDYYQDRCENIPFASIGGLDRRSAMVAPKYVAKEDVAEYLAGYRHAARAGLGEDWETCAFGWTPTVTIVAAEASQ